MKSTHVFDAPTTSRMLGFHDEGHYVAPEAADGEIVVFYKGWSVLALTFCPAVEAMLSWIDPKKNLYKEEAPAGFYRVKQYQFNGTWNVQVARLANTDPTARPAPLAVTATAVLLCLLQTGENPLDGQAVRCLEAHGRGHYCLSVVNGKLFIGDTPDDHQAPSLGLAGAVFIPF